MRRPLDRFRGLTLGKIGAMGCRGSLKHAFLEDLAVFGGAAKASADTGAQRSATGVAS